MRKIFLAAISILSITPALAAESLRCNTQLIDVGAYKAELLEKCGNPQIVDRLYRQ